MLMQNIFTHPELRKRVSHKVTSPGEIEL